MRLKIFLIILLIFHLKICIAKDHETIEEYLYKKIEVIRKVTGSLVSEDDQIMSESRDEESIGQPKFVENPIQCIKKLKARLKNRLPFAISADRTVKTLKEKPNEVHIANKKKLKARHSKLSFSQVGKVILPYNVSSTTKQLNEELVANNVIISELKASMNRTSQMRADDGGDTDLSNVKIKDLVLVGNGHAFVDAVTLTKSPLVLSEEKILQSMSTGQLTVTSNRINKIPLNELLIKSRTKRVGGEKSFKRLIVEDITIDERIQNVPKSVLKRNDEAKLNATRKIEFIGDINVKHLKAKAINRLNLTAFMSDVLLRGGEGELVLNGNLITNSLINVEEFNTKFISNVPVANFMTVSGDQNISSNVFISKFYTSSLNSPIVNGEEFSTRSIATTSTPNMITPKTRFMDISVTKNLNVEGVQGEATKEFVDQIKRHVIGTKTSDLFQLYNGHVIIKGSLRLHDVQFQSLNTNVVVRNVKIFQNLLDNYWMKSIKQNVLSPNFVINNEILATAGVVTASLNGHPMEKFLLINEEKPQDRVWLRFEDVIVKGDLKGHKSNEPSRIFLLSTTVVPRNSQKPIEILGNVEFRNELVIKSLRAGSINSTPVSALVHKNQPVIIIEAPITINNLMTSSLFIDQHLLINTYNNVELSNFFNHALKLSQPVIKIDSINIDGFEAANLQVKQFEGILLDEMVAKLQKEFDTGISRERILTVHGDVTFNENVFVERLNSDTIVNEFIGSLALRNDREILNIGGKKSFTAGVEVKHLSAEKINSRPATRLLNLSLSRGVKQTIKVPVTVRNLEANSLHTNGINEHFYNAFVSKKNLAQPIYSNLHLNEFIVGDLTTNFAAQDLNSMIQSVLFPKRYNWAYINVTKETIATLSQDSQLNQIFTFGVDKNSPQIILAKVSVNTPNFHMKRVKSKWMVRTRTMAIDLHQLIYDSVKNYAKEPQLIYKAKTILKGNRFDANSLTIDAKCSFHSDDINGIDINHLNRTFYRGGNLTGRKHFNYLHVDEFKIKGGRFNGIRPEDIITLKPSLILSEAVFDKLEVKEIFTYSVFGHSFQYFLENRFRKFGDKQIFTSPVVLTTAHFESDAVIPFVNDVPLRDCVFSVSDQMQEIDSHVKVNGRIKFIGPVQIGAVNEQDFRRYLDDSVSRHQAFSCNKLNLRDVEIKEGLKITGIINNREIKELLESDAHSPKLVDLMSLISNVQKLETDIDTHRSIKFSKNRMMYLDTDDSINSQYKVLRSSDDTTCSGNVDLTSHSRGFMITKKNSLMFELSSMRVEVLLPCEDNKLEVRWSYAKEMEGKFNQSFSEYSEGITSNDIHVFEKMDKVFVLLKTFSSVVSFQLDKSSHKWIEFKQRALNFNDVQNISLIQTPQNETFLALIRHNSFEVLIYEFIDEFKFGHTIEPKIRFDVILNLNFAKSSTFLIFADTNGGKVSIHRLNRDTKQFVFQQLLDESLDGIVSVIVLHINEEPFIAISKKSGVFCFYQWRGIENWQTKHCGKFGNLELMKSFNYLNKQRIFLASNINSNVDNSMNALLVHKQGGSS